jgi:hypothetical protein
VETKTGHLEHPRQPVVVSTSVAGSPILSFKSARTTAMRVNYYLKGWPRNFLDKDQTTPVLGAKNAGKEAQNCTFAAKSTFTT